MTKEDLSQGCNVGLISENQCHVPHSQNEKETMIISVDTGKVGKTQHTLLIIT